MRLRWTTPATQDLYNIIRRIQRDNPAAAAKVAETLRRVQQAGGFPSSRSQGTDRRNPRTDIPRLAVHCCLSHSRSEPGDCAHLSWSARLAVNLHEDEGAIIGLRDF